jgi:hypothetical protein
MEEPVPEIMDGSSYTFYQLQTSTLKNGAVCSSETQESIKITWRQIPVTTTDMTPAMLMFHRYLTSSTDLLF